MATQKITHTACTVFLVGNATVEETVPPFNKTKIEESGLDLRIKKSPCPQNDGQKTDGMG